MFNRLSIVELLQDLPEHGLKAGGTGCVMNVLDGGQAYEVAFPHPLIVVEARLLRKWTEADEQGQPAGKKPKA